MGNSLVIKSSGNANSSGTWEFFQSRSKSFKAGYQFGYKENRGTFIFDDLKYSDVKDYALLLLHLSCTCTFKMVSSTNNFQFRLEDNNGVQLFYIDGHINGNNDTLETLPETIIDIWWIAPIATIDTYEYSVNTSGTIDANESNVALAQTGVSEKHTYPGIAPLELVNKVTFIQDIYTLIF